MTSRHRAAWTSATAPVTTVAMVSEHASPLAIVGSTDAGGQNVHVAMLAGALADRGLRVVVHTRRDDPTVPRRVTLRDGVVVDHLDAGPAEPLSKDHLLPYVPAMARELRRRWCRDRPDIVHAHFWMSGLAALDAAAGLGVPVVQTFHALGSVKRRWQGEHDTSPAERIDAERRIGRLADRIVATCSDEVTELATLGVPLERVDVVPSGVDTRVFRPEGAGTAGKGVPPRGDRLRLLTVGRLVPRKGVDDVVRALLTLPDAELLVVGGPDVAGLAADPEARRLCALTRELGVEDRVRLLGRIERDAMPGLLRSADVVVCAPWYEPFGIVPLEAMACGVPVVGTAVGGLLDTLGDDNGVLVPPRRPDLLADRLRDLLADPARRAALGHRGVAVARSGYAWPRVAAATERSYHTALSGLVPAARPPAPSAEVSA